MIAERQKETFGAKARALGLPDKLMYTLSEVVLVTGVPRSTLAVEMEAGRLRYHLPPGRKYGILVKAAWVDEWIESGTHDVMWAQKSKERS